MADSYNQLMLDLETLSSEPNAPIIQIGAVAFDIRTGDIGPRLRLAVRPDFSVTPPSLDTICWWLKQDEGARLSVAQAESGLAPDDACLAFEAFTRQCCVEKFELWAMPPEFDCVILANLFRSVGRKQPWRYNMTRDLRTLEALAGCSSADRVKPDIPHDAGSDAEAQARTAIAYWGRVFRAQPLERIAVSAWEEVVSPSTGRFSGVLHCRVGQLTCRVSPNSEGRFGYSACVYDGTEEGFRASPLIGKFTTRADAQASCISEALRQQVGGVDD